MHNFSVVIPLYNKERHIERAIKSILNQTYQNYEIIVIDDGSTDEGATIVKSFTDNRIRLIQQENAGVSAARNRGIRLASHDLIAFLDADDEWLPKHLEIILDLFNNFKDAGVYSTAYKNIETNGSVRYPKLFGLPPFPWKGIVPNYFYSMTYGDSIVWSSSACVSKKLFNDVGLFLEGIRLGEDLEMWGRIALKYPIAFSSEISAIYHRDANDRACNKYFIEKELPFINTAKSAIKDGKVNDMMIDDLSNYIIKEHIRSAKECYLNIGDSSKARHILLRCKTLNLRQIFQKHFWYIVTYIPLPFIEVIKNIKKYFRLIENHLKYFTQNYI